MSRAAWMLLIVAVILGLAPVQGMAAEEHGGAATAEHGGAATAEHGGAAEAPQDTTTAAAIPAPEETSAPVAEAPAPETVTAPVPALKPIIITFSGELSSVDAAAGVMTVQDRYGVRKEISVPAETKITQGTTARAAADLKVGDKLTVEYTYDVATGKRTAQSIIIGETVSKPVTQ